jgi:hypothetical protein
VTVNGAEYKFEMVNTIKKRSHAHIYHQQYKLEAIPSQHPMGIEADPFLAIVGSSTGSAHDEKNYYVGDVELEFTDGFQSIPITSRDQDVKGKFTYSPLCQKQCDAVEKVLDGRAAARKKVRDWINSGAKQYNQEIADIVGYYSYKKDKIKLKAKAQNYLLVGEITQYSMELVFEALMAFKAKDLRLMLGVIKKQRIEELIIQNKPFTRTGKNLTFGKEQFVIDDNELIQVRKDAARDQCVDVPDWKSSDGYGCAYFDEKKYCLPNKTKGSGWKSSWGDVEKYADANNRDAYEACCVCGGGQRLSDSRRLSADPEESSTLGESSQVIHV